MMLVKPCKSDSFIKQAMRLFSSDVLFMLEEELTADSDEFVDNFILTNIRMLQDDGGFQHVIF